MTRTAVPSIVILSGMNRKAAHGSRRETDGSYQGMASQLEGKCSALEF